MVRGTLESHGMHLWVPRTPDPIISWHGRCPCGRPVFKRTVRGRRGWDEDSCQCSERQGRPAQSCRRSIQEQGLRNRLMDLQPNQRSSLPMVSVACLQCPSDGLNMEPGAVGGVPSRMIDRAEACGHPASGSCKESQHKALEHPYHKDRR